MEHQLSKMWLQLQHMPQFVVTWSIFFGAGLFVYFGYLFKNRRTLSILECLGILAFREAYFRKSLYIDITMYGIGKLTDFIVTAPFVAANLVGTHILVSAASIVFPAHHPVLFNYLWAAACTITMFFAAEASEYIFHFSEHKIALLWEFHKVHHSAHQLNPLTAKRNHPVSLLIGGASRGLMTGLAAGLFVFFFDISTVEALALSLIASKIFIIATLDPLKHSHYRISLGVFDRFLISPHMHQIHHSKLKAHWDKNFGTNISIFDWAFGTAYKPKKDEIPIYGISGYSDQKMQSYNTMYGAYILPLTRAAKIIRRYIEGDVKTQSREEKSSAQLEKPVLGLDQHLEAVMRSSPGIEA